MALRGAAQVAAAHYPNGRAMGCHNSLEPQTHPCPRQLHMAATRINCKEKVRLLELTSGEGSSLLEVDSDHDDSWHVDERQTEAGDNTKRETELTNAGSKRAGQAPDTRYQTTSNGSQPAPEPCSQRTGHRAAYRRDRNEQGPNPRRPAFRLTEDDQQFGEEDAEREAEAVGDHVSREGSQDHCPAPAAVQGLGLGRVHERGRDVVGAGQGPATMPAAVPMRRLLRRPDTGRSRCRVDGFVGRGLRKGARCQVGVLADGGRHPASRQKINVKMSVI